MTTQELTNHPMFKDLLKLWVNHRVEITPQMMDYFYNDYCNKKKYNN